MCSCHCLLPISTAALLRPLCFYRRFLSCRRCLCPPPPPPDSHPLCLCTYARSGGCLCNAACRPSSTHGIMYVHARENRLCTYVCMYLRTVHVHAYSQPAACFLGCLRTRSLASETVPSALMHPPIYHNRSNERVPAPWWWAPAALNAKMPRTGRYELPRPFPHWPLHKWWWW